MKMHAKFRRTCLVLTLVLLVGTAAVTALAADLTTNGEAVCCFAGEEFTPGTTQISGIYLCEVPSASVGKLQFGSRTLKTGDVIPLESLSDVVFCPTTQEEAVATVSYYTISDNHLSPEAILTIGIPSRENHAPEAEDLQLQTYKNLEKSGKLKAKDPDEDTLTFTVTAEPKRGTVKVEPDGTFVYTPQENKVGKDSFRFTVTDSEGNTSADATVSIEILKPTDKQTYADMSGDVNEFEALWLRSAGLFEGSTVSDRLCFAPDQAVSRGDFLVMLMNLAEIDAETQGTTANFADLNSMPAWMHPYVTSALRHGVISGTRTKEGLCFRPNDPITQAEAVTMLQNVLNLDVPETSPVFADEVPVWAQRAYAALSSAGFSLQENYNACLTRRDCACILYAASLKL